ncbi:MAG: hypothetical protein ACTXOO_00850 [Sodalis sp. (in: enterobacteria)]
MKSEISLNIYVNQHVTLKVSSNVSENQKPLDSMQKNTNIKHQSR